MSGPTCPHCGSSDVDRGATGLDECRQCGGLSREGRTLSDYAADTERTTWADPDARLAELGQTEVSWGPGDRAGKLAQLPALDADELLRLRWAVQLGMATCVEDFERFGEAMLVVLASLDTAIAEAWQSIR
jgi:hypothetical protein